MNIPSEPNEAFRDLLNKQIVDRSVENARPALLKEIAAAIELLKAELVQHLPESARGIIKEIIGLDDDGDQRQVKRDMFTPLREKLQDILEKVRKAISEAVLKATQYLANTSTEMMITNLKLALRKESDKLMNTVSGDSNNNNNNSGQRGLNQGSSTSRGFEQGSSTSRGFNQASSTSRGGGDNPLAMFGNLAKGVLGEKNLQMIQTVAENAGMISWVSDYAERSITRTVEMIRPEVHEYIDKETATTSDTVADALKVHMESSLERSAEKGNFLAKIADKIMDMTEEAQGNLGKVEQKFRKHASEFMKWIMTKLGDIIIKLTEFKLRLELDKLPGVRVLGSRRQPLVEFKDGQQQ